MVQEVTFPERKDISSTQKKKGVDKEQQGFSSLFDQAIDSEEQVVVNSSIQKNNSNDSSFRKEEQAIQREDNTCSNKDNGTMTEEKEVGKDTTSLHLLQNLVAEQFQFQFKNEGIIDVNTEEQIVNIGESDSLKGEGGFELVEQTLVDEKQENVLLTEGEHVDSQIIAPQKDKKQNFVEKSYAAGTKISQEEQPSLVINKKLDKVEENGTDALKIDEFNQLNKNVEKQNQIGSWTNGVNRVNKDELNDKSENNIIFQNFTQERIGDYPKENVKILSSTQTSQSTVQDSNEIFARNGIELRENIVEKMTQSLAQNKYELELTLNPEHLGKMSIRISYINEKATVAILCSSKEASQMLAEQAKEIGRIMEQHLKADTFIAVDSKEQDYLEQNLDQSKEQHTHQENKQKKRTYSTQEETQTFMEQLRLGLA